MRKTKQATALTRLYDSLLAMTAEQKRIVLDQLGAPESRQWTVIEKGLLMFRLATCADTLTGTAQEMARTFSNESQRYIGLDILREPTQVITLERMARTLGAKKQKARDIKAGTGARYLAFAFAENTRRRVNGLLYRIGQEIAAQNGNPEQQQDWTQNYTAATIK